MHGVPDWWYEKFGGDKHGSGGTGSSRAQGNNGMCSDAASGVVLTDGKKGARLNAMEVGPISGESRHEGSNPLPSGRALPDGLSQEQVQYVL